MNSFPVKSYWKSYKELSENIQKQADGKFELWKENPFHPSLRFKCVNSEDNVWSVRSIWIVGLSQLKRKI